MDINKYALLFFFISVRPFLQTLEYKISTRILDSNTTKKVLEFSLKQKLLIALLHNYKITHLRLNNKIFCINLW